MTLIVASSILGGVDDAGVSGSQNELDHLDAHIIGVVSGAFRRLTRGGREITVIGDDGWSASGWNRGRIGREVNEVLANSAGWNELAGTRG